MCGITGSLALDNSRPASAAVVDRMTATLRHRGPDDGGSMLIDGVALGFRRLSLVDLDGGAQPMYSEDGHIAMVCNGEIFDHDVLRTELVARGHRFRSSCDVEVLVHLYEEEGPRLLDRLNGQFAFAIYDRPKQQLFLARDHAGIAPLYYTNTGTHFVFGSEIKAILEHPGVRRTVDLTGLDQVLTFPGLVSPRTMFEGISSLEAGHYLLVRDGAVHEKTYWDLDYPVANEATQSDEQYAEQLRELLTTAVGRRMRADTDVGFYLSGGLDSSLIGALAAKSGAPVHSFSITFPGTPIDESRHQRLMAARTGSNHHEAPFTESEIIDGLHRMVAHCETPVKETYNTCSLRLSALARQHGVKAILTGEGADELFGGYLGYRFDAAAWHTGAGDPLEDAFEDDLRERLWGDPDLFYERRYHDWRAKKLDIYSTEVRASFAEFDCLSHPVANHARLVGRPRLSQRSYLDFKLRLADHLLSDHGDRMALANSVEARYPFLDRDVVEFARTVPTRLKVGTRGEKLVLKQAAQGLVPPEIIGREKYGFRAAGSPALLRRDAEWINDMLSPARIARQGYFAPEVVKHLRTRYLSADFDIHPHVDDDLLLTVLTFGILLDTFSLPGHA